MCQKLTLDFIGEVFSLFKFAILPTFTALEDVEPADKKLLSPDKGEDDDESFNNFDKGAGEDDEVLILASSSRTNGTIVLTMSSTLCCPESD